MHLTKVVLIAIALTLSAVPVWASRPYKVYTIKRYGSTDIVCEPYRVQRGDHIWEILRRKGAIAESNFPKFVSILKRFNSHIKDVNKIYPGQRILIPLKQITAKGKADSNRRRYVTVPIIPDVLYSSYKVHRGDCLSKIVTRHLGLSINQIPEEYFQTLRRLNPHIKNVNRIYPGQNIRIPELASQGLFPRDPLSVDPSEDLVSGKSKADGDFGGTQTASAGSAARKGILPPEQRLSGALGMLSGSLARFGARLLDSGICYFPVEQKQDIKLDLAAFPVIESDDGRHLILDTGRHLEQGAEKVIRSFWKPLSIIQIDPKDSARTMLGKIFDAISGNKVRHVLKLPAFDDGVQVTLRGDWIFEQKDCPDCPARYYCITLIDNPSDRTSPMLQAYLAEKNIIVSDILPAGTGGNKRVNMQKTAPAESLLLKAGVSDQEGFVSRLVQAMGYPYDQHVPLSFQYAGFEVRTMTNLLHADNGVNVVVDFGNFYGEAKSAIEASGLKLVSIRPGEGSLAIVHKILNILGVSFNENPTLFAANRHVAKSISVTIKGFLVSDPDRASIFLSWMPVDPRLCGFLSERGVKVLEIQEAS